MHSTSIAGPTVVIRPENDENLLRLRAKLTHTHTDGEELRDLEHRIADLLGDRFLETAVSPSAQQTSRRASKADVLTYRDAQERLRLTISGLSLPTTAENTEAFLKSISAAIAALLRKNKITSVDASMDVCICAVGGTGDVLPGARYGLDEVLDFMANNPPYPEDPPKWRFLYRFWNDWIIFEVPSAITLPPSETEIGLSNRTDWDKEITAWTYCKNRTVTIHQNANVEEPILMRLRAAECYSGEANTIIFRKQKFIGIWTDMYHWDDNRFWELHGGRRITYFWAGQ